MAKKHTFSLSQPVSELLTALADITGMPMSRIVARGIEFYLTSLSPELQEQVHFVLQTTMKGDAKE